MTTPFWPSTISISLSRISCARIVRRDHRGHVEAARDDRGVRRHAAQVGQERAVAVLLELDHVRRREVVRDQDRLLLGHRRGQRARLAQQALQHALADLHDVGLALAQVRILDLLELLDQHAHLLRQRPLGVAALLGDDPLRHLGQRRVVQDHPVHVQERAELARNVAAGHRRVQALQFLLDFLDRLLEARDFRRRPWPAESGSARPRASRARRAARVRSRCRTRRPRRGARS